MQLIFNNINELDEFLVFASKLGRAFNNPDFASLSPLASAPAPRPVEIAADEAPDFTEEIVTELPDPTDLTKPVGPTGRKRRTKAEMAAARATEVASVIAEPAESREPVPAPVEPATVTAAVAAASTGAPAAEPDSAEWIAQRAAELGPLQPIVHLGACREFIAEHGMQAYNDVFATCGLPANVMGYTSEQAALHVASLEFAGRALTGRTAA